MYLHKTLHNEDNRPLRTLGGKKTWRSFHPNRLKLCLHLPSKQPMPAKPKLGQNFLVDSEAIQRIAASIGDLTGRTVVEIGPGRGAITAALAARAAHVVAVELDAHLATALCVEFPREPSARVTVLEQDA